MSNLTWARACARVAGVISGARQGDSTAAARDAISETLEDWDSRRDWRFTQTVAPDITLSSSSEFDLPAPFKKPYVAYLSTNPRPLYFVERGNWHRVFPGTATASMGQYYTLYNEASTGKGQLFPPVISDILTVLYYRPIITAGSDDEFLDIPQRWQGYILRGARALLTTGKSAGKKSDDWWSLYEKGLAEARKDDLRIPDQFVSFLPPDAMSQSAWVNLNSSWESVVGA